MHERLILLEREIERDLETLAELWERLDSAALDDSAGEERRISIAYWLHNIYGACENVFRNVAEAFENSIDEKSGWHTQLLNRMRLDLRPLRPAVIDDATFTRLDELRRFRHLFRAAYGIDFESERLAIVRGKALELRTMFPEQIAAFLDFLRQVRATGEDDRP